MIFMEYLRILGTEITPGGASTRPREWGAHPGGRERPPPSWAHGGSPDVFSVPIILKYSGKNHISFSGHLENFYFGVFLYCTDNSENREIILFLLYLI